MKLIVYYDDNYPTWWVSREISKKITSFLRSKNFVEYNAEDLAKWMEKSIEEKSCSESVVVFSQDVIPDAICFWWSPSTLIREYLDSGGRIVWIGDSPFYYWGQHPSRSSEFEKWSEDKKRRWRLLEDREGNFALTWDTDGPFNTLGVVPIYMDSPSSKVKITENGKSSGIQSSWYGLRPILIKKSGCRKRNITILARASQPERPIQKKKAWLYKSTVKEGGGPLSSLLESLSKFVGLTPALLALVSALVTFFIGFSLIVPLFFLAATIAFFIGFLMYWVFYSREVFASAWMRNFDNQHPSSGFLRIWDCQLKRITNPMLEELHRIVLASVRARESNNAKPQ